MGIKKGRQIKRPFILPKSSPPNALNDPKKVSLSIFSKSCPRVIEMIKMVESIIPKPKNSE